MLQGSACSIFDGERLTSLGQAAQTEPRQDASLCWVWLSLDPTTARSVSCPRFHQPYDIAHDGVEAEVLRREDGGYAEALQVLGVSGRDDAAYDHRHVVEPALPH